MATEYRDRAPKHVQFDPKLVSRFIRLLDKSSSREGDCQEFLEQHSELLPAYILQNHGLHFNAVISKFPLDTSLKTDFAYLAKSTDHWWLVLVELENPHNPLLRRNGPHRIETQEMRHALAQIDAWREFIRKNRDEVLRRLEPLRVPLAANDVYVRYHLVIGRTRTEAEAAAVADRFATIGETGTVVDTYDSLVRHYEHGPRFRKNILSLRGTQFRFKHLHTADLGSMLSYISPAAVRLSPTQRDFLIDAGYDIASWENGEQLTVNGMLPSRKLKEVVRRVLRKR